MDIEDNAVGPPAQQFGQSALALLERRPAPGDAAETPEPAKRDSRLVYLSRLRLCAASSLSSRCPELLFHAARCAAYTDVQVLSALRRMQCDGAPSHMQLGRFLLRAYWQVGQVSCGRNTLTVPHLNRRVRHGALAVVGRRNSLAERLDLTGYATCIPSSADRVACGTSRKATQ
jgi:hypothetical protein